MSELHPTQRQPAGSPDSEATGVYQPIETASGLVSVLDRYLAELQAGKAPDKAQLLAEHPDLARQLEDCLAGIEFVHRTAKSPATAPTQLGDFRIIREVGRGGMGVVYEAEQQSLKRKVALKVLRFGVTADPEVMQRFQREAETVAHLHHTNIVPIHAVGCEQGVHYYAMQFIEGQSLAAVAQELQQNEGAPPATLEKFHEISGWMLQAAEALAHAHQRGVIHRDIKPSNLILDPEGTVWLTDFGLAKRADEVTLTAAGILMGTPRYMSPEQAAAATQPIDHRTDIYSLGATLYELATGKPVFDSQTPQGVITQILNAEPVAPRVIQGKLPRDLETIILKCLAKEPARRYQQARDLADDLRAFLENRPIRARRANLAERLARWSRKHRRSTAVSAVTAAASVLVIVGTYLGWSAYQESLLGQLLLKTDGPSLVAEVLDDNDEPIMPGFPVPTPQPVTLRAGTYRVRLSGSGQLSETWQMDVERGRTKEFPVKLLDRLVGPPIEIGGTDAPLLTELNGQTHFLYRAGRAWRLTNGATLAPAWPRDLTQYPEKPEDAPVPKSYVSGAWHDLLQVSSMSYGSETGNSPGLAQPAADVDGDGRDDLIFASRVSPSLVAVSGKEGKVLWWYRALPNFPAGHDVDQDPIELKNSAENAGIIGQPIVLNLDGEPTVIAIYVSHSTHLVTRSGKDLTSGRSFYVEAVAARTGMRVWRTAIDLPELATTYVGDLVKLVSAKPEVVQLQGRSTIALTINTKCFGFDVKSGTSLWTAYDLGSRPVQAPQFTDLDGDGQTDALFLYRKSKDSEELALRAVALHDRQTLWERSFLRPGYLQHDEWHAPGDDVALAADLDGDGKTEVAVPVKDDWSKHGKHWFGVQVLDGVTGNPRWERRVWTMPFAQSAGSGGGTPLRMLVGPDLNGDRHRELFVASFGSTLNYPQEDHYLQVEALSGQGGEILWRRRLKIVPHTNSLERQGGLQWWQADDNGWPHLVVPINGGGGQPMTYILAAASGRLAHILPEVSAPQVADVNSDGIPDLYHVASGQGSRRLTVIKGLPPVEWRRPVNWLSAGDYDGDGTPDFREWTTGEFSESHLAARSGASGRMLWQTRVQPDSNSSTRRCTLDIDVDGDRTPDIVLLEQITTQRGVGTAISAISGRDGHHLWTAPEFGLQSGSTSSSGGGPHREYSYPMLDHRDLDGDGRPEILIAAHIDHANGIVLAALSNAEGRLLWKIPIVTGGYTGESLIDRNIWHDLNGDGVLDIVLWAPKSINEHGVHIGSELRAFSGRDGQPLWKEAAQTAFEWAWWPRTAIGDLDNDGVPEVVITSHDYKGQNELLVVNGGDGQKKWNWSGSLGGYDSLWPPVLVDAAGDRQRLICLGVQEQSPTGSSTNIVVFNPQGEIRHRIPVGWLVPAYAWGALDVDGDGKEELLFVHDSHLHAHRLSDNSDLWKRPIDSYWLRLTDFRPGAKDQQGTLVAWSDRTAIGLNAATGASTWRCEVPRPDPYQLVADLSFEENGGELPVVVSHSAQFVNTLVQRAWPTTGAGAYQAPTAAPLTFAEYQDPIRYRPLPWAGRRLLPTRSGPYADPPMKRLLGLSEWPLVLLVFGTFGYWSIQGRWGRASLYLLAYLLTTLINGAVMLAVTARNLDATESFSWDGWYWGLYVGAIAMGFFTVVTFVIIFLVRQTRRALAKMLSPA
ncbi:MAG: protein kinase [Planctomycetia bacterium]|nr:protein kinase [Planctomycetia bacterium]